MIVIIYINGITHPITKEVSSLDELKEELCFFGYQRVDKVTITDFRPLERQKPDGSTEHVKPDF